MDLGRFLVSLMPYVVFSDFCVTPSQINRWIWPVKRCLLEFLFSSRFLWIRKQCLRWKSCKGAAVLHHYEWYFFFAQVVTQNCWTGRIAGLGIESLRVFTSLTHEEPSYIMRPSVVLFLWVRAHCFDGNCKTSKIVTINSSACRTQNRQLLPKSFFEVLDIPLKSRFFRFTDQGDTSPRIL